MTHVQHRVGVAYGDTALWAWWDGRMVGLGELPAAPEPLAGLAGTDPDFARSNRTQQVQSTEQSHPSITRRAAPVHPPWSICLIQN